MRALIGAVPVIPARAVADVLATGTVAHARVWHIANVGFVLAVYRDKIHPEVGKLVFRGWEYSTKYHLAYTRISLRRTA